MYATRNYAVTVTHPTGFHAGTFAVKVTRGEHPAPHHFVHGEPFGCSRDYYEENDITAIRRFLQEHACTVVNLVCVSPLTTGDAVEDAESRIPPYRVLPIR